MSLLRSWSRFQRASYKDFAPTELGVTATKSVREPGLSLHPDCKSGSITFFRTGYFADPLFKIGLFAERQSPAPSPLSERRENQRRAMTNNRKLCFVAGLTTVLRIVLVAAQGQNSE